MNKSGYRLYMPYRYLLKLMGREPDEIGNNDRYLDCCVNPVWHFDEFDVQSWDYNWFTDRDTNILLPVREVGANAVYEEDPGDVKVNENYEDDYAGIIDFYYINLLFKNNISDDKKNSIVHDLIKKYVHMFNDEPNIEYQADKMIQNVDGKYIKMAWMKNIYKHCNTLFL
jgi:hypothetical protein